MQYAASRPPRGELVDSRHDPVLAIGIDTGGTFTDIYVSDGTVLKVPSTPDDPGRAMLEGLEAARVGREASVAHGTTVATNAVLERTGARTVLLTTAGFEDVLEIRRQNRPAIYDLTARWPPPLVPRERRVGVPERLDYEGRVLEPLSPEASRELAQRVQQHEPEAVGVCLLFSYANPEHEDGMLAALRAQLGENFPLSASHEVSPQYGEYERTSTTVLNAYVMPTMRRYLNRLQQKMRDLGAREFLVMHSNGGLVRAEVAAQRPVATVLSGPAAGVVGARAVARAVGRTHIITFDMGGTSTDVAVVPGTILEGSDGEVAGFPLQVPMLTIETVGAGGGSIASVDGGGGLHVGPESAGADPGPVAYGVGDEPTVTDANLVLGRLSERGLLGGALALRVERSRDALGSLGERLGLSAEQAAWAVVRLANSNMERAVHAVTLQRGYDPRRFTLVPFGGAGPLHAAELADGLGIDEILVPPHPGVMAALGLTVPDLQRDYVRTVLLRVTPGVCRELVEVFDALERTAREDLDRERSCGEPKMTRSLDMRYVGQSFELRAPYSDGADALLSTFKGQYRERYGIDGGNGEVEIVHVRLRAILPRRLAPRLIPPWPETARPQSERTVWFGSAVAVTRLAPAKAAVHWRPSLPAGSEIHGPAVVEQYDSTTVVPPRWSGRVDEAFNLLLRSGT